MAQTHQTQRWRCLLSGAAVRGGLTAVGGVILVATSREGDESADQDDDLEEVHV